MLQESEKNRGERMHGMLLQSTVKQGYTRKKAFPRIYAITIILNERNFSIVSAMNGSAIFILLA